MVSDQRDFVIAHGGRTQGGVLSFCCLGFGFSVSEFRQVVLFVALDLGFCCQNVAQ